MAQVFCFLDSLQNYFLFFYIYSDDFYKKSLNFVVDGISGILLDFLKDICHYQKEIVDLKIDQDKDNLRLDEILKNKLSRLKDLSFYIMERELVPNYFLFEANEIFVKFMENVLDTYKNFKQFNNLKKKND